MGLKAIPWRDVIELAFEKSPDNLPIPRFETTSKIKRMKPATTHEIRKVECGCLIHSGCKRVKLTGERL